MKTKNFREDINGLRAWAVIAVVLFHFKIVGFEAGFFGVDIFFVISGFLMTSIIVRGLEAGNFSIFGFYLARFRRIVPALVVLLAVLFVLGWLYLPTPDYISLAREIYNAAIFTSNFHFWKNAGYFDTVAQDKWLLHTWSLGVEMQFYIAFPIIAVLLWKLRPQLSTVAWFLIIAFVSSLLLSIFVSSSKIDFAFYLLPTRSWELAAGGLVYLISKNYTFSPKTSSLLFVTGSALLIAGFILIDPSFYWPSYWGLFPVVGAMLIIVANVDFKIISNPIFSYFGNISYSLYLYHWVVVVALYFSGLDQEPLWVVAGILLSILFADISYRAIETPTRKNLIKLSSKKQWILFILLISLIFAFGKMVRNEKISLSDRLDPEIESVLEASVKKFLFDLSAISKDNKTYGNNPIGAILLGDSHAGSATTALAATSNSNGKALYNLAMGACPMIEGISTFGLDSCYKHNNRVLNEELIKIDPSIPAVVIHRGYIYLNAKEAKMPKATFVESGINFRSASYEEKAKEAMISTICKVAQNRDVYIVRPTPEMHVNVPNRIARDMAFGKKNYDIKITLEEHREKHKKEWEIQDIMVKECGVKTLDPTGFLCDEQFCYGTRDNKPLYSDKNHLTEYGSELLIPMFEAIFTDQIE